MRASVSLLALSLALASCGGPTRRATIARAHGAWYWHNPVRLSGDEAAHLRTMEVSELYALAGTFSNDGERFVLRLRRTFEPIARELPIRRLHLVYRFDGGGVHRALDDDPKAVAATIARVYAEDRKKAEAAGWQVLGLQLDLDCPTRRLPRYGEVLAALRGAALPGTSLSITGLGDWLNGDVSAPLRSVDFWCPQLYEFESPRELAALGPLSSAGRIAALRPKLERLGVPYRVGVAAHGQTLVYAEGGLEGTAQGLAPSTAARTYPVETSVSSVPGEERAAYRVGPNRVLLFRRPDPRAVRDALVRERTATGLDAGFVLFRVAEPGEELTPSLATLALGPEPRDVEIATRAVGDPFAAIERGAGTVDRSITLTLRSRAKTAPPLATDGLEVRLSFTPGSIVSIAPGDFPNLRLLDATGHGPVSLARATGAVGFAPGVPPGDSLTLGPIVKKSGKLRVLARVRGYGREATAEKEL